MKDLLLVVVLSLVVGAVTSLKTDSNFVAKKLNTEVYTSAN